MKSEDKFVKAVKILRDKSDALGRTPKKSDFEQKELCFIKGVLGPFPRALEKAGLKEIPEKIRLRQKRKK